MSFFVRRSSSSQCLLQLRKNHCQRSQHLHLPFAAQPRFRYATKTPLPLPYKPPPSSKQTNPVKPIASAKPSVPDSNTPSIPASTTPTATTSSSSSPPNLSSTINPPASTLPPPLNLPVRDSSQSAPSYYFSLGKAYLAFYRTGLYAIYTNYKACRPLRSRLSSASVPNALEGYHAGILTRAEYYLLKRTSRDVSRIPLFALVFLVCGEFTPLVVVFMSGVVPRTCWIPKQIDSARQKTEKRRSRALYSSAHLYDTLANAAPASLDQLKDEVALHFARVFSLYPSWWDRLGFLPMPLIRGRVIKALKELKIDHEAIRQGGGVKALSEEEVRIAAEERGLDVVDRSDEEVRAVLREYVEERS